MNISHWPCPKIQVKNMSKPNPRIYHIPLENAFQKLRLNLLWIRQISKTSFLEGYVEPLSIVFCEHEKVEGKGAPLVFLPRNPSIIWP